MISFKHKGDFKRTDTFFKSVKLKWYMAIFKKYGQEGVNALSAATPIDSGETAHSWSYEVKTTDSGATISWLNSNAPGGVPIAILIQYGHGTKNGGYVQGNDFINPAMRPIFDRITESISREVASL